MNNEIVVNATPGETRVAILEKGSFVELYIERASTRSMVGNVVKGRVTRVLPGMQAAFVDIGLEKAAFLYVGDYLAETDADADGDSGRRRRRNGNGRQFPKIETLLSEGQEVVVQVAKEPIGTKGARITSHVSIAGRHLVLTPSGRRVGVSRRIGSDKERRRLRDTVERMRPKDLGFIIRTAGDGVREPDLEADVKYLAETWEEIQSGKAQARAPHILYHEPDLPMRVIRDAAGSGTNRIVIDDPGVYAQLKTFVDRFMVDPPTIEHYEGDLPIFDHFELEEQIDRNLGRKVWLKSGGYLIVDQSEALTAIDVNTGRYVGKRDLEETVLKTNLEAVREVVHQLRFRNIGGLIIIDLIDMDDFTNREKVYRALQEVLRDDKARTNILKISELGLVEMTRKRTRENLVQVLGEPCSYCEGKGYVLSPESVAFRVLREIRKDLPRLSGRRISVTVSRRVGELLLGRDRPALEALEASLGREIEISVRPNLHHEQFEVRTSDPGSGVAFTPTWLGEGPGNGADAEAEDAEVEADEAAAAARAAQEAAESEASAEPDVAEETGEPLEAPAAAIDSPDPEAPSGAPEPFQAVPAEPPPAPEPDPGLEPQALDAEEESRILPDSEKPEGS
jgi:ribonuclease G